MLYRVDSFFEWLDVPISDRVRAEQLSEEACKAAEGMTHLNDYLALSAVLLYFQPRLIFEIGTYKGVTSDFFLQLSPDSEVVSIAYVQPFLSFMGRNYNNSELSRKEVGSYVAAERRSRFHQLYGDSHKLDPNILRQEFGAFDLVFIDGDHCADGVRQDTGLAKSVIADDGVICWHDANPKEKYLDVRLYLEQELPIPAAATMDNYTGGIACWSRQIETRLALSKTT